MTTRGLTKRFGRVTALDDVDFALPRGTILGLLGPNGSGKTTLLSVLAGFIKPTSGDFTLMGESNHRTALARTGSLISSPPLWSHLSCRDNLRCLQGIYTGSRDRGRVEQLLIEVGLGGSSATRKFGQCSTGMKQRLGIAAALIDDPTLLLLDEPTNGLDPEGMVEIRELVRELGQREGRSIIMSSHLLAEVERTCDHYAIIFRGNLVAQGRIGETPADVSETRISTTDDAAAAERLRQRGWTVTADDAPAAGCAALTVQTRPDEEWKPIRDLAEVNIYPTSMRPGARTGDRSTLEELYLSAVGSTEAQESGGATCQTS